MEQRIAKKRTAEEERGSPRKVERALKGLGLVAVAGVLVAVAFSIARAYAVLGGEPWAVESDGSEGSQGASYVGRLWDEVSQGVSSGEKAPGEVGVGEAGISGAVLEEMGFRTSATQAEDKEIPSWVTEEITDLSSWGSWIAVCDWSLLGLYSSRGESEFRGRLMEGLQGKGWTIPAGQERDASVLTLTKEKGACRWMMVSWAQTGGEESVVLRIQHG